MGTPKTGFDNTKLVVGAGVIAANFVEPTGGNNGSWDALFATRGGVQVGVVPQIRYVEADGLKINTKEALVVDDTEVKLSTTVINADITAINAALPTSKVQANALTATDKIAAEQFKSTYFIVWLGSGKIGVHTIPNCLATNGLNLKTNDKGEAELTVEFTGHYEVANLDVVPYSYKEYTLN